MAILDAEFVSKLISDRWWLPSDDDLRAIAPGRMTIKVLAVELGADGGADVAAKASIWINVESRLGSEIGGTIAASGLDRDGYRVGDRLTIRTGQVFDLATLDDQGQSQLNEARAQYAIGKRVLLGLTVLSPAGSVVEQRQLVGELATVDPERGLRLALDDGSSYWLPPDARGLEEAHQVSTDYGPRERSSLTPITSALGPLRAPQLTLPDRRPPASKSRSHRLSTRDRCWCSIVRAAGWLPVRRTGAHDSVGAIAGSPARDRHRCPRVEHADDTRGRSCRSGRAGPSVLGCDDELWRSTGTPRR